ncbi:hypothetical protein PTI98_000026 [Pleurotus ostreatus]|nr:hypothetical protein PTI98_000026 [Pleurotus ostreatus]
MIIVFEENCPDVLQNFVRPFNDLNDVALCLNAMDEQLESRNEDFHYPKQSSGLSVPRSRHHVHSLLNPDRNPISNIRRRG